MTVHLLYIFWILHQTTTYVCALSAGGTLYIFWILHQTTTAWDLATKQMCCISFESYIKPQLLSTYRCTSSVVYLLNPTSNHNHICQLSYIRPLYIFWILHQTTTAAAAAAMVVLYIFWILHQTTTHRLNSSPTTQLYIFWILHQTTTSRRTTTLQQCCISFESYIKPQLVAELPRFSSVVYLLNPTSNHN